MRSFENYLPSDYRKAFLVGRLWEPRIGPTLFKICGDNIVDISEFGPTSSEFMEREDLMEITEKLNQGRVICSLKEVIENSLKEPDVPLGEVNKPRLLSPVDLQSIKACGVTFAISMMERVIEERAGGDRDKAKKIRREIEGVIGGQIKNIKPNSEEAIALKKHLIEKGFWSQYLEVGIGPYAEVFTKAQPLSTVGFGSSVGILSYSEWNNPEPEIVLIVNPKGAIVGATLGNDVNLRDIEGLSALLLGKAKDNNGSCSMGPLIRIFDDYFTIDDIKNSEISLEIKGREDDFFLNEICAMKDISRDPKDLVQQVYSDSHQYPDGFSLFLGTLFAPVQDRNHSGGGFTHKLGDEVFIESDKLGTLTNTVQYSNQIPPWEFGIKSLIYNLLKRKLIK